MIIQVFLFFSLFSNSAKHKHSTEKARAKNITTKPVKICAQKCVSAHSIMRAGIIAKKKRIDMLGNHLYE